MDENCCAYVSSIDMLKKSDWLKYIKVSKVSENGLNEELRKILQSGDGSYKQAVNEIRSFA